MSDDQEGFLNNACYVEVMIGGKVEDLSWQQTQLDSRLDNSIDQSERLLTELGKTLPPSKTTNLRVVKPPSLISVPSWEELVQEARQVIPNNASIHDILTEDEIQQVLDHHASIGDELGWFQSLDRYDIALSVSAGAIAGLIDVLLVKVPAHPGFLGSEAHEGGWLSNIIKEKSRQLLPADKIRKLEKAYKAPYDPAVNSSLFRPIAGLGPRTHRYHSLGHDPWLGFIFGIRDILTGEFTAIDKFGKVIIQQTGIPLEGETFIVRILEAMKIHLGHLLSDVATPAGLPAPLMPLLSFLQFGKIGDKEYTIAEVARQMYRSGYDFRHFIATAIPVAMTEFIIRLGHFIKTKQRGDEDESAFYSKSSLALRRKLLVASSVGMLINAGKVSITKNPLGISWAQTLAFLRYAAPELHFILHGKEGIRAQLVEDEILTGHHKLNDNIDNFLNTQTDFVIEL